MLLSVKDRSELRLTVPQINVSFVRFLLLRASQLVSKTGTTRKRVLRQKYPPKAGIRLPPLLT